MRWRRRRVFRRQVRIDALERSLGVPSLAAGPGDCGRHCKVCCRCEFCDLMWVRYERAMFASGVGVCRVGCLDAPRVQWTGPPPSIA